MKKQNPLLAYILIGIGLFFLLRELKIPIITDFYSWQTLLIVVGAAFLIHSYRSKSYEHIFTGVFILGIGIHLHGVAHYDFWIDHWGMYLVIIGLAFLFRYFKTKTGLLPGTFFLVIGLLLIYSQQFNQYFYWVHDLVSIVERFWPILLIILGFYWLRKGK
jgi:membrane-bound ClpP family serine protease